MLTLLVGVVRFGDNRQLYPWELAREGSSDSLSWAGTASSPHMPDLEKGFHSDKGPHFDSSSAMSTTPKHESAPAFPSANNSPRPNNGSSPALPSFSYFPAYSSSVHGSDSDKSETTKGGVSSSKGVLYFAPAAMQLQQSSKVWERFTRITEPVVSEAQWRLVMAAAGYGVLAMVLTAAVCLSVPNRHR